MTPADTPRDYAPEGDPPQPTVLLYIPPSLHRIIIYPPLPPPSPSFFLPTIVANLGSDPTNNTLHDFNMYYNCIHLFTITDS